MNRGRSGHNQTGAALIFSLLVLLVLTVLGLATMNTAAMELLMSGNTQFQLRAFYKAEAMLRAAETQLSAIEPPVAGSASKPRLLDATAKEGTSVEFLGCELHDGTPEPECTNTAPAYLLYRVTARARDISGATASLQSIYAVAVQNTGDNHVGGHPPPRHIRRAWAELQ